MKTSQIFLSVVCVLAAILSECYSVPQWRPQGRFGKRTDRITAADPATNVSSGVFGGERGGTTFPLLFSEPERVPLLLWKKIVCSHYAFPYFLFYQYITEHDSSVPYFGNFHTREIAVETLFSKKDLGNRSFRPVLCSTTGVTGYPPCESASLEARDLEAVLDF